MGLRVFADSNDAAAIPGLGVSVGVSRKADPDLDGGSGSYPLITYRSETAADGSLKVLPVLISNPVSNPDIKHWKPFDYLKRLGAGGPIEPINFAGPCYNIGFPTLDFKVVNNGAASLYFTQAIVKVASSHVDAAPFIQLFSDYDEDMYFTVCNDGWGPVDAMTLKFNLVSKVPATPAETYQFTRDLGPFAESLDVQIGDELVQAGVPADYVQKNTAWAEAFRKENALSMKLGDAYNKDPDYLALENQMGKLQDGITAMLKDSNPPGPFPPA